MAITTKAVMSMTNGTGVGRPARALAETFVEALQGAASAMHQASEADIVALYPYDAETDSFYAPVAIGLPETDVVQALPDIADQLHRFRADEAQGKTPDDLSPAHYGPNAWLLSTRQPLITPDAPREVNSSFVRRHKIYAIVGLPLLSGGRVVGLLYLDYVDKGSGERIDVTTQDYLQRMGDAAMAAAQTIDAARRATESAMLDALSDLVGAFSALPSTVSGEGVAALHLETALERLLSAAQLGAAALYAPDASGTQMAVVASYGCPALAAEAALIPLSTPEQAYQDPTVVAALERQGLYALTALSPRNQAAHGVLILADRDPLALQRRIPEERTLLQTATDLLGGMLDNGHLVAALDETNRTLGAVTRLSTRLLQPGATQEQAVRTAVSALTDPSLPELDFEFAALFQLETAPDGELMVSSSTGATASPAIDAVLDPVAGATRRIPRWVTRGGRVLDPHDILSYVATRQRVVVVAAQANPDDDLFVNGYPEDRLERLEARVLGADGSSAGVVHAARLREAADRAPLHTAETAAEGIVYRATDEVTLDADLFASYGHASLVRVFVPFGSDDEGQRATGVLEAGYHIGRKGRLERVQIEALRACAATVAVAIETARLYEDVAHRAQQLEIVTEVGRAIAASIDLEQTLHLVARNMARAVDASICLIALLEEDGSAWYGAASSDAEEVWRQRRVERPTPSIVFDVADRGKPMVVKDAQDHELVSGHIARVLGIRSLMALPLMAGEGEGEAIGVVFLGQRDRTRIFNAQEVERTAGLAGQAAIAIRNARLHALEEEEQHIQKDVVLIGFGQWGQKAYQHLLLLKNFFNFRVHVVEYERPGRRETLVEAEAQVMANGDLFYWDSQATPSPAALALELESSCYVITYIAAPAETHLPLLKSYYALSNVVLIEKPLGAPPEEYRAFLDRTDGSVQIVAADHYWFKTEVRLLQLLLTEERNLRAFLDEIEEVEVEILEAQTPGGSGAQIGMIADLIPHAFAILSLLTPLTGLKLAEHHPLQIGCFQPRSSEHETYARLEGSFQHRGRPVRVTIDVGKGVTNAKWIKLSGGRRMGGRRSFYKFDFTKGEAIDGTQSALRAATRPIRQPGVPDNAHLSMLRHVIEKKHPAVGILSIREALRANARIQELEQMAAELLKKGQWAPYEAGQRPEFADDTPVQLGEAEEAGTIAGAHNSHILRAGR